ncbi:leucine/isoleucine/valine transporter permease subunit [Streptomyces sp. YIM 130001]|uniref:branched-chain amino acid ABC transporter permease n=1 Tax=Streptomyces sp. YIM 130001 TaxID=2259644 RepID=UPI000E654048|nr:ABC transporter permease [Streptomyces sp. YIM 130001]RII13891.1 leucine/isoleucine/valine transporter permease subunit [Streptomyces sp. YIM 130001]
MPVLDAHLVPAIDGVAYGLLLFVVAAGLSLAFGTAGVLNLSHGALYAIGAYLGAELSDGTWAGMLLGLAAGTAAACAAGALLSVATAPLAGRGHLAQALLTFGLALVVGDLLVAIYGADELPVRVPGALDASVSLFGHRYPAYRLTFIGMAVLLAAAGTWVLTRTRAGAAVRASADDPQMLAATGINPKAVHAGVLAAAGALAGAAGVLGAPIIGPGPDTADTVLMLSLVIVVLGGLRSLWGVLFAAIGVGQVQTLGVSVAPDWAPYLLFASMAAVLVLRRGGAMAAEGGGPELAAASGGRKEALSRLRARIAAATARAVRARGALPRFASRGPRARTMRRILPYAVLLGLLAAVPSLLDAYSVSLVGYGLALGLVAVSVTVLTGYAGLPTLGQTAPFAVGAYATALLADGGITVGPVQVTLAALAAAVFALVTGPAVIRARGTTVLMITLAVGELTSTVIGQAKSVTGGTDGLYGFPATEPFWGSGPLADERSAYVYVLTVAALAVAATWLFLRSSAGKLLTGTRGAEERMRASGHPVARYLMLAYVGAGALAGIGGSLLVTIQEYVSPADAGFEIAALALLAVVIGGATSVVGALFGVGLIVVTRDWLAGIWPGHGSLLLGILFVLAVYLLPRGLAGLRLPRTQDPSASGSTDGPGSGSPQAASSLPAHRTETKDATDRTIEATP